MLTSIGYCVREASAVWHDDSTRSRSVSAVQSDELFQIRSSAEAEVAPGNACGIPLYPES
jgi:hypothetical protein